VTVRAEAVMGTTISVEIVDGRLMTPPEPLLDSVFDWFRSVDDRFARDRPSSEVSRFGRGELAIGDASSDLQIVVAACEEMRARTNGYFDAYATGHFDPSGYVKGWSVQVAADRLRANGVTDFCVNAGGDVYAAGVAPGGSAWRIGVRHPWEAMKVGWIVAATDLAVATSGTYERGPHVIDPVGGTPATYLRSVTVTGADLALADALATAAVAMGERGVPWLASLEEQGYASAVVTAAGDTYRSGTVPTV
jgi:thiamine biosynthesis lipoprotein